MHHSPHDKLTEAQLAAVEHMDGPLLVLAGPGSGKTRVITHRIARLLSRGVPARQIVALTFTNKAADEMRSRVERLAPGEKVWLSTFHRFCSRLLRDHASLVGLEENFTIYDSGDSQQAIRRLMEGLPEEAILYSPDRVAGAISWSKNNLITCEEYVPRPGNPLGKIVARVFPLYQARLLASNAVDFDDLLLHVATLLRENEEVRRELDRRFRYLLVDEYQDTNLAQYAIVRALSIDYPNLCVTGDPDQSIYGWRGANLNNIVDFEHDFPQVRVVKLERNYRSTKRILAVADALITRNVRRKAKGLFTENDEGARVRLVFHATQLDEAAAIAMRVAREIRAARRRPRDFAIFYRVNALSRAFEIALRAQGVPYQIIKGLEFYQRREIKDVLAYLKLLNNPRDDEAFLRIVNTPPRGIGRATIDRLRAHAARKRLSLLDAAREAGLADTISKRAAVAAARFVSFFDRLAAMSSNSVEEILGHVLEASGYQAFLDQSDDEEDLDRLANIQELLSAARQFDEDHFGDDALEVFLEEASLVSDVDAWDAEGDRVTLMTLHASKGLEFPVVFIVAVEQGLLPHERSREHLDLIEEERRLLFVGITRARDELELSVARYREFRGQRRMTIPSSFLLELPRAEMDLIDETDVIDETAEERRFSESAEEGGAIDATGGSEETEQPAAAPRAAAGMVLAVAADLHAPPLPSPQISPELFHQGMLVRHDEYGLGKIVALSGGGRNRRATVAFASTAGEKTFVLAQSKLRPAKSLPE